MQPIKPIPIYDNLAFIKQQELAKQNEGTNDAAYKKKDFAVVKEFLLQYAGSDDTFNAYRRELEKLMQWAWLVRGQSIILLERADIENYIEFCRNPPKLWIGLKTVARFRNNIVIANASLESKTQDLSSPPAALTSSDARIANPEWRPFVATLSKAQIKEGKKPSIEDYQLSQTALKELFAITSSFYNYLIQIDLRANNPLLQIRQKNKYLQKVQQGIQQVRRLSVLQWDYVLETAENMAKADATQHERTLFIVTILYGMYLRISELVETRRWQPKMSDFYRDADGLWWFKTVGKGNKLREISVSDAVLKALKRWRAFLGLTLLPTPADGTPLLPRTKGKGGLADTRQVRNIVQECFDNAIGRLKNDGLLEEAEAMQDATVHWLRHTGISDDVKIRPREHVRDDAGHSSGAITDRYINVERRERHSTAEKKPLKQE